MRSGKHRSEMNRNLPYSCTTCRFYLKARLRGEVTELKLPALYELRPSIASRPSRCYLVAACLQRSIAAHSRGKQSDYMKPWPRLFSNLAAMMLTSLLLLSCGGGSSSSPAATSVQGNASASPLSASQVNTVVQNAMQSVNSPMIVAVVDRPGNILAIARTPGVPSTATATGNFGQTVSAEELAVGLARTAAFFSNDQAPLSSRTVRFISGIHFPPGVANTANADLYGIENTNRGCTLSTNFLPGQAVPPARSINGTSPGLGIILGAYLFLIRARSAAWVS